MHRINSSNFKATATILSEEIDQCSVNILMFRHQFDESKGFVALAVKRNEKISVLL